MRHLWAADRHCDESSHMPALWRRRARFANTRRSEQFSRGTGAHLENVGLMLKRSFVAIEGDHADCDAWLRGPVPWRDRRGADRRWPRLSMDNNLQDQRL